MTAKAVPVLVLFGPTGCGKTGQLSRLFAKNAASPLADKAEVISADSVQVYRGLNIGSAKPDNALREALPRQTPERLSPGNLPAEELRFLHPDSAPRPGGP